MKHFLLILILVFPFSSINSQWVQTNGATGYQIFCLAENGKNLFAGSFNGGIFLSTNDGSDWFPARNNLNGNVYSLAVMGGNVFAGTDNTIFLTTNNGSSWAQVDSGINTNYTPALFVNGLNLYAGGAGGVYSTTDNGMHWKQINDPWGELRNVTINQLIITPVSGGTGTSYIFAGCNHGVYRSTNNGESWTLKNNGLTDSVITTFAYIPDYTGAGYINLYVGTEGGGGVFRSTDYGMNWTPVNNGLEIKPNMAVYAFAVNGSDLFVSTGGGIFLTKDYGLNWFYVDEGFNATARSLLVTNASKLIAGTLFYGIWSRPLSEMTTIENFPDNEFPQNFSLEQNFPNPFNPSTIISWQLPIHSHVSLKVYDINGKKVITLIDEKQSAGYHSCQFSIFNSQLTSGIYFYRIIAGEFVETKKLLLLK
jgi:photosystem II stability/assembly factor-like uncharacterized protein